MPLSSWADWSISRQFPFVICGANGYRNGRGSTIANTKIRKESCDATRQIYFQKIGPIKRAELELGDITIIAGRNNTGKTYLVYTLYGFLKQWNMQMAMSPETEKIVEEMMDKGRFTRTVDRKTLDRERKKIIRELSRSFSRRNLADVFSSPSDAFEESSIEVELSCKFPKDVQIDRGLVSIQYDGTNILITGKYIKRSYHYSGLLLYYYCRFLFPELSLDPFILSAERFGISLFYKELDFTKNQLVEYLQRMGDKKDRELISPSLFIGRTTSRYALPIKDNIDYTRDISNLKRQRSEIYDDKLFDKIKDMMGGYYSSASDDIAFISRRKGRSFNLPLHIASSSARGLSDLYFYLRHVAEKNQLVIIDEPESHLDTANQILLARLLARMIQSNLKVLITTHSDYIIKEINNLIMLNRLKNKKKVAKELGYKEDDFIEPDAIRAYVAEGDSLTQCEIDEFGIDMPVFDETINKINRTSIELASHLEEDGDE